MLVPKLFDRLAIYSQDKSDDVKYCAFSIIKVLADKGFANHTRVLFIII